MSSLVLQQDLLRGWVVFTDVALQNKNPLFYNDIMSTPSCFDVRQTSDVSAMFFSAPGMRFDVYSSPLVSDESKSPVYNDFPPI